MYGPPHRGGRRPATSGHRGVGGGGDRFPSRPPPCSGECPSHELHDSELYRSRDHLATLGLSGPSQAAARMRQTLAGVAARGDQQHIQQARRLNAHWEHLGLLSPGFSEELGSGQGAGARPGGRPPGGAGGRHPTSGMGRSIGGGAPRMGGGRRPPMGGSHMGGDGAGDGRRPGPQGRVNMIPHGAGCGGPSHGMAMDGGGRSRGAGAPVRNNIIPRDHSVGPIRPGMLRANRKYPGEWSDDEGSDGGDGDDGEFPPEWYQRNFSV